MDDAPSASEYLTDPEVMRFIGGDIVPRGDVPNVIQKWLDRWENDELGHFVVERRADSRFVGRVGFVVWDTRVWRHTTFAEAGVHAQLELGWALVRAHWGHGFATEAARAARDWVYRERRNERLISLISPKNLASQRVAKRLGARPSGMVTLFDSGDAEVWEHPR
jgi:RimJ/RimL family protein N-acetyltransferase